MNSENNWYQSFNNFGEVLFHCAWVETRAHPTLIAKCFWIPPCELHPTGWVFY